jgi:hypothetical protein
VIIYTCTNGALVEQLRHKKAVSFYVLSNNLYENSQSLRL